MRIHVSYDKQSGELLVNWEHDRLGYYDQNAYADHGVSVKHEVESGDVVGIMIEAVDLIAPDLDDFTIDVQVEQSGRDI